MVLSTRTLTLLLVTTFALIYCGIETTDYQPMFNSIDERASDTVLIPYVTVEKKPFSITQLEKKIFFPLKYKQHIDEVLAFLLQKFGEPLFHGSIEIQIVDNYEYSRMEWIGGKRKSKKRVIKIPRVDMEIGRPYRLAHELFHALYQTEDFIKSFPDFIIEGMAIYAEYMYRYRDLSNSQILEKIRRELKAVGAYQGLRKIDPDKPFYMYSTGAIDVAYLMSGMFFFVQNQNHHNFLLIRRMLEYKLPRVRKLKFREVVHLFNLKKCF